MSGIKRFLYYLTLIALRAIYWLLKLIVSPVLILAFIPLIVSFVIMCLCFLVIMMVADLKEEYSERFEERINGKAKDIH